MIPKGHLRDKDPPIPRRLQLAMCTEPDKGENDAGSATTSNTPCLNCECVPSIPPCLGISYAKIPNQYGPYAYCSLDKAVDAQVQKEKIAW